MIQFRARRWNCSSLQDSLDQQVTNQGPQPLLWFTIQQVTNAILLFRPYWNLNCFGGFYNTYIITPTALFAFFLTLYWISSQVSLIKAHLGERLGPSSMVRFTFSRMMILDTRWYPVDLNIQIFDRNPLFAGGWEDGQSASLGHKLPLPTGDHHFSLAGACLCQNFISNLGIRRLQCTAQCHVCRKQTSTPCSTPIPTMELGRKRKQNFCQDIRLYHSLLKCLTQECSWQQVQQQGDEGKRSALIFFSVTKDIFRGVEAAKVERAEMCEEVAAHRAAEKVSNGIKLFCSHLKYADGKYH